MGWFMLAGMVLIAMVGSAAALAGGSDCVTARAEGRPGLSLLQQRLLSGTAALRFEQSQAADKRAVAGAQRSVVHGGGQTAPGCPADHGRNVRVNQECQQLSDPDLAGRGQAQNETSIAQDPNDSSRLVASSNDYIRGDGNCYAHYSSDKGRSLA
jgi:hypothetical protein